MKNESTYDYRSLSGKLLTRGTVITKRFLIATALTIISGLASGDEGTILTGTDISDINAEATPFVSAGQLVHEKIEEWMRKKGLSSGVRTTTGKIYYTGTATVSVTPEHPSWAKSRQIAFKKALNKARTEFIYNTWGNEITKTTGTSTTDDSTNVRDGYENVCALNKIDALREKVVALTGAKLDAALRDAGVDPDEYKSAPSEQQRDLFMESQITKVRQTAAGSISGLIPVQTFEGRDSKGTSEVGVIMVFSPKLAVLADDMKNGREPSLQGKRGGKPISEFVDIKESDLQNLLGMRIVFDEQAIPVILSYGQWGYSYRGNSGTAQGRHRNKAFEKADIQASSAITEFVNGKLRMEKTSETGELVREYLKIRCDGIQDHAEETIIDKLSSEINIVASSKASGTSVVKRWSYINEYGKEIVGVVRAWSLDGMDTANAVRDQRKAVASRGNVVRHKKNHAVSISSSHEISNPEEDF